MTLCLYQSLLCLMTNHRGSRVTKPILQSGTSITHTLIAPLFSPRDPAGHKGTFGSVGILGGAAGMTGAALLAARTALKAGAGKVLVGLAQTPMPLACDLIQPELMLRHADALLEDHASIHAWAAGCGLGQKEEAAAWLRTLFTVHGGSPIVLDADGLNLLSNEAVRPTWGQGLVVLTPHPAEAARLLGTTTQQVQSDRPGAAKALASQFKSWVVLKGTGTIVCAPDLSWQINTTGNVGLASGGTGDVLSGLLASLLAQGIAPEIAVTGAVWLHGCAADVLVNEGKGPIGLTASELAEAIRMLRNHARSED